MENKENRKKDLEDFLLRKIKEWSDKSKNTSGHKKLVQYFERIIRGDYFESKLKEIREKYKIPKNGFPPNEHYPIYPMEWVYRKDVKVMNKIEKEIKGICKRFSLHYMDWRKPIDEYVFYNTYTLEYESYNSFNLCIVSDLLKGKKEPYGKEFAESDDMAYPIAVRISPFASIRDILEFIKAHSFLIKGNQREYLDKNTKIGKEKRKKHSIQERNDFIYKNRHLPRKQIMKMLGDKYGENFDIDYGYIGKIISLEKKKRKDV